jgi:DNA-binding winged helix-turn-helix (wHTH) protein/tetratricopeptide (TPR) repeat protein
MSQDNKSYRFGDFLFEPDENRLTCDGKVIHLAPKAYAVLEILVRRAGHVVDKDELLREVWDDLAIEESAVPRTVWQIRNALGDNPKKHVFILTVPKRGYRFVADVTDPRTGEEGRQRREWSRPIFRRRIAIMGLILVSITAVAMSSFFFRSQESSGFEAVAATDRGTINEEAYRLFGQASYAYERRNAESARKAVELLEQAIQLDPTFARAWAAKARAIRYSAVMSGSEDISEAYKESLTAVERALSLDPNLSEGHSALCELKFTYEFDFDGAEIACRRAIELQPNSAIARVINSRFLNSRGRHSEAIKEIKAAIDLEPSSVYYQRNLGITLFYSRRYDEAARQLTRVIEMEKDFESSIPWLVATFAMQGMFDEAFEWSMRWQGRRSDEGQLADLRQAYELSGWNGFLQKQLELQVTGTPFYFSACQNAQIGDKDKALELLEKAYARREWGSAFLGVDPRLDPLRGDPRFEDLMARVGD